MTWAEIICLINENDADESSHNFNYLINEAAILWVISAFLFARIVLHFEDLGIAHQAL